MEELRGDRRSRLSRRFLKEALIELMKTKSIHEISIKKICETADVNRSTFYRYYDSPYQLYDEIIADVSLEIRRLVEDCPEGPNRLRRLLTDVFSYIEENRELMLVLLSSNGNIGLGETFSEIVRRLTTSDTDSELNMYCTQFISAGLTNIVWIWLNNEKRRSPKEIAMMLSALFTYGVNKAMLLSDPDGGEKTSV